MLLLSGCTAVPPENSSPAAEPSSSTQEENSMENTQGKPYVLQLDSFDGGGYEYSVTIGNPDILSCSSGRDYGAVSDEPIDGASYTASFTFSGLKAGTTKVTVSAQSPIMESYELLYTASVDQNLNVTFTPEITVSRLLLFRNTSEEDWYFILTREMGEYFLTRDDAEPPYQIDASVGDKIYKILDRYDVQSWDGFSESTHGRGEQFLLEIRLTDGTTISARGDFIYPDNYQEVMKQITKILDKY